MALHVLAFLLAAITAFGAEVTAEGKAAGDAPNARELALADALREAVRVGVGTDVLSATEVRDFVLEYDRVFSAAFGYVKNYTVLSSGLSPDRLYRVKVRATVGAGQPATRDTLALRQIVQLKGSPRVALAIEEQIDGSTDGRLTREWLIAAAKEMQLNLVEAKTVAGQADRLAARDNLTGNQRQAEWRRAGIPTDVDFVIEGIVRAKSNVDEYGGAKFTSVTLAVDLRAVRADTGAVLAALPMKTIQLRSDLAAPDLAAREKLHLVLDGKPGTEYLGAWPLFRHIFAAWLTELDLGAMVRLELAGLGDADHDRLLKTLGETDKINAVFPREFDSQGLSFVDVETRLDAGALKAVVLQTLGGGWRLDRTTKHYLQFRRGTTGNHEIHETHESRSTATNGLPSWLWALIGAGAVALLGGVFLLGKRRGGG